MEWRNSPFKIEVSEGDTKAFCMCGLSKNAPFCDGSHSSTDITPKVITFEENKTVFACGCKQSANRPFCDGTHTRLKKADAETKTASTSTAATPASTKSTGPVEPYIETIQHLAKHGLSKTGHHGPMVAMGVPRSELPQWDDIQFVTAQLANFPLLEEEAVDTKVTIGKKAKKPLTLDIPLFVSDMSFGSLSMEAKLALAKGAELSGTGICSGEGGMLEEEKAHNNHYFYELASAQFGFSVEKAVQAQAFHFKGGQAAKTGIGGHLPGHKVTEKIAQVRQLEVGQDAISPARFQNISDLSGFTDIAEEIREASGGIPIGFKLSAQQIEKDIEAALKIGVDYIILDGRGGGTGAAPALFRDHISVPTIPALARARKFLDANDPDVSLVITGGLRVAPDFAKALALGADAIAVSNSALQAIGCLGMRACNTNTCPTGIATQDPELRKQLKVETAAQNLSRFFNATTELMVMMARACGHQSLQGFNPADLTTWKQEMAALSGITYGGVAGR